MLTELGLEHRMSHRWRVDRFHSYLTGQLLRAVTITTLSHPLPAERIWQIWAELVFVCICHQTNWDRLHDRVMRIASDDMGAIMPDSLCSMDASRFRDLFVPGLDASRIRATERLRF